MLSGAGGAFCAAANDASTTHRKTAARLVRWKKTEDTAELEALHIRVSPAEMCSQVGWEQSRKSCLRAVGYPSSVDEKSDGRLRFQNFPAEIVPDILRHIEKDFHNLRIELPSGPLLN